MTSKTEGNSFIEGQSHPPRDTGLTDSNVNSAEERDGGDALEHAGSTLAPTKPASQANDTEAAVKPSKMKQFQEKLGIDVGTVLMMFK